MKEPDFKDHYIGYLGHPKFIVNKIIEDDIIRVIIQKYEMLLFTNKGELLGDSDFGCDLQKLLFETRIAKSGVRTIIIDQINKYITEIQNTNYVLDVEFSTDPENFQEVMEINFTIADYKVYSFVK